MGNNLEIAGSRVLNHNESGHLNLHAAVVAPVSSTFKVVEYKQTNYDKPKMEAQEVS